MPKFLKDPSKRVTFVFSTLLCISFVPAMWLTFVILGTPLYLMDWKTIWVFPWLFWCGSVFSLAF
jgi:hypothetical protein